MRDDGRVHARLQTKVSATVSNQPEPTKMLPVDSAADDTTANLSLGIYAPTDAERQAAEDEAMRAAEEARARAEERAARDRALGAVPVTSDDDVVPPAPPKADNDKFFASLGLVILRLVLAGFIGVRGVQVIFDITGTTQWLADRRVPRPEVSAWLLGVLLLFFAIMLVIGFGTRYAAGLVAAAAIAVLVYIQWGYAPMLAEGQAGFLGDTELLVAAAGIALMCVGSGGWAFDAAIRRGRAQRRMYYQ